MKTSCLYKHSESDHSEYTTLKAENEHLKSEIEILLETLEKTKTKLTEISAENRTVKYKMEKTLVLVKQN